jgi:hypothetical protein
MTTTTHENEYQTYMSTLAKIDPHRHRAAQSRRREIVKLLNDTIEQEKRRPVTIGDVSFGESVTRIASATVLLRYFEGVRKRSDRTRAWKDEHIGVVLKRGLLN